MRWKGGGRGRGSRVSARSGVSPTYEGVLKALAQMLEAA
jgi:hypothetical protein